MYISYKNQNSNKNLIKIRMYISHLYRKKSHRVTMLRFSPVIFSWKVRYSLRFTVGNYVATEIAWVSRMFQTCDAGTWRHVERRKKITHACFQIFLFFYTELTNEQQTSLLSTLPRRSHSTRFQWEDIIRSCRLIIYTHTLPSYARN